MYFFIESLFENINNALHYRLINNEITHLLRHNQPMRNGYILYYAKKKFNHIISRNPVNINLISRNIKLCFYKIFNYIIAILRHNNQLRQCRIAEYLGISRHIDNNWITHNILKKMEDRNLIKRILGKQAIYHLL